MLMMHTVGHDYVPPSVHAGGLRYHGMSPLVSAAVEQGYVNAVAYDQLETFEAGETFAKTEGIIPAPESNHAIKAAIDEAIRCRQTGEEKSIIFCLSGHGMLDLNGYSEYLDGSMKSSS
jgi:tryptophan synthase beta chain